MGSTIPRVPRTISGRDEGAPIRRLTVYNDDHTSSSPYTTTVAHSDLDLVNAALALLRDAGLVTAWTSESAWSLDRAQSAAEDVVRGIFGVSPSAYGPDARATYEIAESLVSMARKSLPVGQMESGL
jgi:hypothetical protein